MAKKKVTKKVTAKKSSKIMRLTILACDHREEFSDEELSNAEDEVTNGEFNGFLQEFPQNLVDSNIMFVSTKELSEAQMEELFNAGDLCLGDNVWEGTYEEILQQASENLRASGALDEE